MKFYLFNLLLISIFIILVKDGVVGEVIMADKTYLVVFIFLLFLYGLYLSARNYVELNPKTIATLHDIRDYLVFMGLIGTVVGFILALKGVEPQSVSDVSKIAPMIVDLMSGISTALYTTLIGSLGWLWLSCNIRMILNR